LGEEEGVQVGVFQSDAQAVQDPVLLGESDHVLRDFKLNHMLEDVTSWLPAAADSGNC
jgi:hypothetical protein